MASAEEKITKAWKAVTAGSAETIDISCNEAHWYIFIDTSAPASYVTGRKLKPDTVYNIVLTGSDVLYVRSAIKHSNLIID